MLILSVCHMGILKTENRLRGYVTYFLWNGSIPSYKHIKICGVRFYTINGSVNRKELDNISHPNYFWYMRILQELLLILIQTRTFIPTNPIMIGLMNIIIFSPQKRSILLVLYYLNNILKLFFIIRI